MNLKLAAIIFFAAIIRISALNSHDFWFDEAFTYHVAKLPIKELIKSISADNNPPLYYLVMHYLLKIGSHEIFLRIPSVAFSLATIPIIFALSNKLANTRVALLSVSLFALSPLSVYLATEARLHSLALFLALALSAAFLNLLNGSNFKAKISFVILSVLGLYTQYYIILLFIPFTLLVVKQKTRLSIKNWLIIASTSAIFVLPWLLFSSQTNHANCWCPSTFLSLPASLVSPAIAGVGIVTMRAFTDLPFAYLILFFITSTAIILLFMKGLLKGGSLSIIYLTLLSFLTLIGFFSPVFSPKGFAVFLPLYLIIAGIGIESLKSKKWLTPLLLILLGLVSIIQTGNSFFRGEKLKEVASTVSLYPNTPIAHTSLVTYYSIAFYTNQSQQNIFLTSNPMPSQILKYIGGHKQLIDDSVKNLWLVDTHKWTNNTERQEVVNYLLKDFEISENYTIDNIFVSYLTRE